MTRQTAADGLTLELQDAYWELPSGNYVPHGSVPPQLLEDSDHLDASWDATVDSMKDDAAEGQDVRSQIRAEIDAYQKRHKPEASIEVPPATGAVASSSVGAALPARLVSAVSGLRRSLGRRNRSSYYGSTS
jgi:hypothetical protein